MKRMDRLHLDYPFAGSRMLRDLLRQEGYCIGRKHVATLMKRMGVEALYRKPRTTKPGAGHNKIYPYLLRHMAVTRPNQVWAMDITYSAPRLGIDRGAYPWNAREKGGIHKCLALRCGRA